MFKNYLKIALRNMRKYKIYSLINTAGLSIGIACFLAIYLYVRFEMSYDDYHENANRIYRVATKVSSLKMSGNKNEYASICGPAAPMLKENFPQIENIARFRFDRRVLIQYVDKMFYESNLLFADQELFTIFKIPVIHGNPNNLLIRPRTMAISKKIANKYFGNEDPMGKVVKVDNTDFEITGVIENPPRNTHIKYDFIASLDYEIGPKWYREMWNITSFYTYLKFNQDIDIKSFENSMNNLLKSKGDLDNARTFFLQPVIDIHLHSDLLYEVESPGNPTSLYILTIIGVFIVLFASVNFINLTTARSTSRAKEVGLRKVIGAGRGQLIQQFLGESLLISMLAMIAAYYLVLLLLPLLSVLTGIEFIKNDLFNTEIIIGLLVFASIIGLGAGIYPAFLISGIRPTPTLKGIYRSGSGGSALRKYLVVFQFAVSVILIISTLTAYLQIGYMKNAKLGFDKEQKLIIPANLAENNYESIKNEFLQYHNIKSAVASSSVPGRGISRFGTWLKGTNYDGIDFNQLTVDYDFSLGYKLEIISGAEFRKGMVGNASRVCIINETAVKVLEINYPEDALGRELCVGNSSNQYRIIGVVKDFHYRGLQHKIEPLCILLPDSQPSFISSLSTITLTIDTNNISETLGFVENKWKELNLGAIFNYRFLDEDFERLYRTEERVERIFTTFTALGLFIAFLGLFGLALYTAEQRTKEIGIRKVLGASLTGIVHLMNKDFVKWILISNLIAWPIAYYTMNKWLQNFAYRINMEWWTFVFAGLVTLLIALVTVIYHSLKAALTNPVESLRYE